MLLNRHVGAPVEGFGSHPAGTSLEGEKQLVSESRIVERIAEIADRREFASFDPNLTWPMKPVDGSPHRGNAKILHETVGQRGLAGRVRTIDGHKDAISLANQARNVRSDCLDQVHPARVSR